MVDTSTEDEVRVSIVVYLRRKAEGFLEGYGAHAPEWEKPMAAQFNWAADEIERRRDRHTR